MSLKQSIIPRQSKADTGTWFLWTASLLMSLHLCASIMRPLSIAEMTKESDAIVRGEVLSKTCERDSQGRIYTQIELAVHEVWKGVVNANKLMIVQGGGVLGEERVIVTGQVQYDLGEEVVTFIVYNGAHEGVTLGMAQGKFHLHHPTGTSKVYAHNPFHGMAPGTEAKLSNVPPPEALTVEDLKSKVLAAK